MNIADSIARLGDYYQRHGFFATMERGGLAIKRILFSSRMVVFYFDLGMQAAAQVPIPNSLKVERFAAYAELSQQDLREMTSFWSPKLAHRNIRDRFEKGASLWLIRSEGSLAGYGWTLQGQTMEPYYFPLAPEDAHLFDFHVFRRYRGQGINPLFVTCILWNLGLNCRGRAFIEAAEWNQAQLLSLQKTPFRRLGLVRSFTMFGQTLVFWAQKEA
jgi:hypothetical protein